jgi:hypothetical protein
MKRAMLVAVVVAAAGCGGGGGTDVVTPPPQPTVKTVTVSPDNALLSPGDTVRLAAIAKDASGNTMNGVTIAWTSSSLAVATVSSSGTVTAITTGSVSITASVGSISGGALVTVQPASSPGSVKVVELAYPTALLARGQALQMVASLKDSVGRAITGRALRWSSANSSIVRVDSVGSSTTLTAAGAGTTTVTATIEGVSATSTVTVVAFAAVSAGPTFSCAVSTVGQAFCAGDIYGSLAKPVGGSLRFSSVSVDGIGPGAGTSACGFAIDGSVYCWGENGSGQLGVGDRTNRAQPTRISSSVQFASLSIGRDYACGLSVAADAYCWGNGNTGQLGTGDTLSTSTPVAVKGLKYSQIEAGYGTTCALTTAGKAWCWGRNDLGQLGLGTVGGQLNDQIPVPTQVGEPLASATLKQIVTRGPKTCGITDTGAAYCWGNNTVFELGTTAGTTTCFGFKPCSLTPLPVTSSAVFKFLSATQFSTCGLTASNETLCWGLDFENSFGATETVPACATSGTAYGCTAKPVAGPSGLLTLTGARSNYCGMKADGIAYCWGGNEFGQRGWGGATPDPTPRPFSIAPASALN